MVKTLNKACGDSGIPEPRLEKCFDVWYTHLETSLNELRKENPETTQETLEIDNTSPSSEILEEILELSRDNQKLLRNPDSKLYDDIEKVKEYLEQISSRNSAMNEEKRVSKKYRSMLLDEFFHINYRKSYYGFLMVLSLIKEDFPWIYDMGKELLEIIKADNDRETKETAIRDFREMIEFTYGHPVMREMFGRNKHSMMIIKDLPYFLATYMEQLSAEFIK